MILVITDIESRLRDWITFVEGHGRFELGCILLFMPLGILITKPSFKIMISTSASKNSSEDMCLYATVLCADLYSNLMSNRLDTRRCRMNILESH